jgi:flagellin
MDVINTIFERLDKVSKNSSENSPIESLGELAVAAASVEGGISSKAASYTLHIGANYSFGIGGKWGNEMTVTYLSLNPGALGLAQRDIKTQINSTDAIDQLDKVIKSVSGARAKIGTFINRLEYTINNIANLEFNTQDAESRIRDTDFAKETTNFTRNQIMVQSATSMLAQANALPQSVLGLIG